MRRWLFRELAALLLLAGLFTPLPAQGPAPSPSSPPPTPESEKAPPVLQWVVAGACSALVLLIVCMPSRKA
jgi:hypothetical protein